MCRRSTAGSMIVLILGGGNVHLRSFDAFFKKCKFCYRSHHGSHPGLHLNCLDNSVFTYYTTNDTTLRPHSTRGMWIYHEHDIAFLEIPHILCPFS